MTQNIYDQEDFFQAYGGLERSVQGLEGAAEWPTLRGMLPDMQGLRVLDLGCGYGWFCRWAHEQGASSVLGIDVSEKMLARAEAAMQDAAIIYTRKDMERLDLPEGSYDLAYSSLAFHYIENLDGLLANVYRALAPGGQLVFSVEHPLFTASRNPNWAVDFETRTSWTVDSYQDEGARTTNWLVDGVKKQHRTLATYANMLLALGFSLSEILEWSPTEEQVVEHPLWAAYRQVPPFLLMAARR